MNNNQEGQKQNPQGWSGLHLQDKAMVLLTFGLLAVAGVTAIILKFQFTEMDLQTKLLGRQLESDAVGGSLAAMQIRKQLSIAQQQARAAQQSADAIQRQTRTSERAWMEISFPPTLETFENKPVRMTVQFTNNGRTVARAVLAEVVIEMVPKKESARFDYGLYHSLFSTGLITPGQGFPVAGEYFRQKVARSGEELKVPDLSHEEYERFMGGNAYFAVYARVRYKDIFGIHHWTRRCYFVSQGPAFASKCTNYADVDSN